VEDSDRSALREVTRACFAGLVDHTSTATVLAAAAEFRRADWLGMAELGLLGAAIPEDLGGAGLGEEAALLVHAEAGRALYAGPVLGTMGQVVPALTVLAELPAARDLLARIATGELTAAALTPSTVVLADPDRPASGQAFSSVTATQAHPEVGAALTAATATPAGQGWLLRGRFGCVPDADLADGLLVAAAHAGEISLFWLAADAPGLVVQPLPTVDLTRRLARVMLSDAPAQLLAGPAAGAQSAKLARAALAAAHRGAMLALIAEAVSIGERALEMTVSYVANRQQFGRPIGSFQAVKHRCAEMLVRLEMARSAWHLATMPTGSSLEAAARLSAARLCAGAAAFAITNEAIHLHGGIGFTWDYPVHLYYRRAKSNQQLLDSDGQQRVALGATVAALYAEQSQPEAAVPVG
jgi:alkylation response protein AidB-like acyl-CoA dehydrogenase